MAPLIIIGLVAGAIALGAGVTWLVRTFSGEPEQEVHRYTIPVNVTLRDKHGTWRVSVWWTDWNQIEWWPGEIWGHGEE